MKRIPSVAVEFLNEPKDIGSFLLNEGYVPKDEENCKFRKFMNEDKTIQIIYHWLEGAITLEGLWSVAAILPQTLEAKAKASDLGIRLARKYKGIFYDGYRNPYDGVFKISGDEK